MDNLADWYRGAMAPPMAAGAGLIPRPIPAANGSTVAKTYTARLGQDVPSSQAALAIDGRFGRGLPQDAMAFMPTAAPSLPAAPAPGPMPMQLPMPGRNRKPQVIGTAIPAQQQGGLLGMLQSLFGQHGQPKPSEGGLLGMLQGNGQRITAPGGGGAFIARPGTPAADAGAGSGSLMPASMNNSRWNTGY